MAEDLKKTPGTMHTACVRVFRSAIREVPDVVVQAVDLLLKQADLAGAGMFTVNVRTRDPIEVTEEAEGDTPPIVRVLDNTTSTSVVLEVCPPARNAERFLLNLKAPRGTGLGVATLRSKLHDSLLANEGDITWPRRKKGPPTAAAIARAQDRIERVFIYMYDPADAIMLNEAGTHYIGLAKSDLTEELAELIGYGKHAKNGALPSLRTMLGRMDRGLLGESRFLLTPLSKKRGDERLDWEKMWAQATVEKWYSALHLAQKLTDEEVRLLNEAIEQRVNCHIKVPILADVPQSTFFEEECAQFGLISDHKTESDRWKFNDAMWKQILELREAWRALDVNWFPARETDITTGDAEETLNADAQPEAAPVSSTVAVTASDNADSAETSGVEDQDILTYTISSLGSDVVRNLPGFYPEGVVHGLIALLGLNGRILDGEDRLNVLTELAEALPALRRAEQEAILNTQLAGLRAQVVDLSKKTGLPAQDVMNALALEWPPGLKS